MDTIIDLCRAQAQTKIEASAGQSMMMVLASAAPIVATASAKCEDEQNDYKECGAGHGEPIPLFKCRILADEVFFLRRARSAASRSAALPFSIVILSFLAPPRLNHASQADASGPMHRACQPERGRFVESGAG